MEVAAAANIACEEGRILPGELASADEIFFTNTSWGALPVALLDGNRVGAGSAGPMALELGRGLAELVERECTP